MFFHLLKQSKIIFLVWKQNTFPKSDRIELFAEVDRFASTDNEKYVQLLHQDVIEKCQNWIGMIKQG